MAFVPGEARDLSGVALKRPEMSAGRDCERADASPCQSIKSPEGSTQFAAAGPPPRAGAKNLLRTAPWPRLRPHASTYAPSAE